MLFQQKLLKVYVKIVLFLVKRWNRGAGESKEHGALVPVESSCTVSPMHVWIQLFRMLRLEPHPEGRGYTEGWLGLGESSLGHMLSS